MNTFVKVAVVTVVVWAGYRFIVPMIAPFLPAALQNTMGTLLTALIVALLVVWFAPMLTRVVA